MKSIKLKLGSTSRTISFGEVFHGNKEAFYNLLGNNYDQEKEGSFSFSSIGGGIPVKDRQSGDIALSFSNGGIWSFSTIDDELMDQVYRGLIQNRGDFMFGMEVLECEEYSKRIIGGDNWFVSRPGVALSEQIQDSPHQLSFEEDGFELFSELEYFAKQRILNFFPDLDVDGLSIRGVEDQENAYKKKTAMLDRNRIFFTEGPIIVSGPSELVNIVAHMGLGDKTHLGIGYLQPIFPKS